MTRILALYPAGSLGAGLLLLRAAAAAFALNAILTGELSFAATAGVAVVGLMFCLGLVTQFTAAIAVVLAIAWKIAFADGPTTFLVGEVLMFAAVALLGPGAYSIDAALFGRRTVHVPRQDR